MSQCSLATRGFPLPTLRLCRFSVPLLLRPPISKITETSPFHNLAVADLADIHGQLGAEIAELEARRKTIAAEMIRRGIRHIEGDLFETTVVAEAMVANLDREAIERDMGESWLAKYLKWTKRCASVRTTPCAAVVAEPDAA
jgi:hypothetical protein